MFLKYDCDSFCEIQAAVYHTNLNIKKINIFYHYEF